MSGSPASPAAAGTGRARGGEAPRIAVLADIHGNVPALEAVLGDLERQQVDEVLVGGDLVGRGPQGGEVVRRIQAHGWPSVRGNHEDYLLAFRHGEVPAEWRRADVWAASRWMADELSPGEVRYIETLPFSVVSRLDPGLLLVHGSPSSNQDGLGPWSPDGELEAHANGIEQDLLVCAHTHRPLERMLPSGLVVNVGSVGLPFNRDRRAQYAIFQRRGGTWHTEPRRVDYDLERIFEIYRASGFLAAGGVTAALLRLELEEATPYLVPFLRWTAKLRIEPSLDQLGSFRRFYEPGESLRVFFQRLHRLERQPGAS